MTLATNGLNPGTKIYTWTYADAAARTGATGFVAGDVGSVALQLDDGSLWRLTATTPAWQAFSGGFANPMTTSGDVIIGGSSGTPTRLAKGGNNTVLGVDGSGNLGYKADPSGGSGGLTKIGEQVLASPAASVTFSSIAGTYRYLELVWTGCGTGGGPVVLSIQLNGDTGANYDGSILSASGTTVVTSTTLASVSVRIGAVGGAGQNWSSGTLRLYDYAAATRQRVGDAECVRNDANSVGNIILDRHAVIWRNAAAAITSLVVFPGSGNLDTGSTFALYGVA